MKTRMSKLLTQAKQLAREASEARVALLPEDILAATGLFDPEHRRTELQMEIMNRDKRFNSRVLHRRFGKTVMEIGKLIDRAVENPLTAPRYAYFAPTYAQAEDIAWHYLVEAHENICENLALAPRELQDKSKLAVWFPTRAGHRARIRLYGLDSPKQRVRGLYLDGAVFDEWPWIPPSAYYDQVRPMLSDDGRAVEDVRGRRNQWVDFIFTPFGRDHAYELHRKAELWQAGQAVIERDPDSQEELLLRSDDWTATTIAASQSRLIDENELAAMRAEMGRSRYEQEMECSFDAAVEGSIYGREIETARQQGRVRMVPVNPFLPVHTAWDLGFDDATSIWFFQRLSDGVALVDFYEASGAGLDHYADVLAQKDYRYGRMLVPHDAAQHSVQTGDSTLNVLKKLGIRATIVPKHRVWDGVSVAQALLPVCVFDAERTAQGMDHLALYRREFNEKLRTFSQNPRHDQHSHAADAFRVLAMGLKMTPKPGSRPQTTAEMY